MPTVLIVGAAICPCPLAAAENARSAASTNCQLLAYVSGEGVQLSGEVRGPSGTSGQYVLNVAKRDMDGVSRIKQGGTFAIDETGQTRVGLAVVTVAPSGTVEMAMTLSASGVSVSCKRTLKGEALRKLENL